MSRRLQKLFELCSAEILDPEIMGVNLGVSIIKNKIFIYGMKKHDKLSLRIRCFVCPLKFRRCFSCNLEIKIFDGENCTANKSLKFEKYLKSMVRDIKDDIIYHAKVSKIFDDAWFV